MPQRRNNPHENNEHHQKDTDQDTNQAAHCIDLYPNRGSHVLPIQHHLYQTYRSN